MMDGPAAHNAHLVLLHFGRARVALAQRAVRSLEAAADVDFSTAPPGTLGVIVASGGRWPVFALDEELVPLHDVPRERRICALLAHDHGLYGLLCDEAQVLRRQGLSAYPLPLAMRRPATPLEGVLQTGEGVALLSSARSLAGVVKMEKLALEAA
jgi:hypothetical protein